MTEVLSQDEIDQILTAINAGDNEPEDFRPSRDSRRIKIYDFKRPDKFSKEQIRAVSIIHESFARLMTAHISSYCRMMAHFHVASVDQLTYEEFIRSIPTPTTLAIINMDPMNGNAIMEIDPAITFAIIDLVLGGEGEGLKCQHELTDIESSLMEEVIVRQLSCLREAWTHIIDLRPKLAQIDTNPQFAQIVPPTEMVVLVTLEARLGDVEGMVNLCIPYLTITGIIDRLSFAYWYGQKIPLVKDHALIERQNVPVKMVAEILRRDYSIQEISNWGIRTVLVPIRPLAPNFCFLRLGDRRLWRCKILKDDKRFLKKIKIVECVGNPFETEGMKMDMAKINSAVTDALSMANITISVELGSTAMLVKEVLGIGEGTIIELDKLAGEPVDVKANGVLIAKGEVVVIDENFGVRIIEIIGGSAADKEPAADKENTPPFPNKPSPFRNFSDTFFDNVEKREGNPGTESGTEGALNSDEIDALLAGVDANQSTQT